MADEDSIQGTSFDEIIAVEGADRRYVANVDPSWDGPIGTHGGVLAAIGLNAIDHELNPNGELQIRSLTAQYLRAPKHGPVEIFVDPLRSGRRFSSSRAVMSQGGKPCISFLATHSGPDLEELLNFSPPLPDVRPAPSRDAQSIPALEMTESSDNWIEFPDEAPTFFKRVLCAPRFGHGPFMGPDVDPAAGTENGGWIATREPRNIDVFWLAFLVDSFWPSVLQPLRTPGIAPTLDLTIHFRAALPAGGLADQPLLVYNNSISAAGGLADSDSQIFSQDGQLLAQARQLQLLAPFGPQGERGFSPPQT
jgi:acyl-CoA thioesterase